MYIYTQYINNVMLHERKLLFIVYIHLYTIFNTKIHQNQIDIILNP